MSARHCVDQCVFNQHVCSYQLTRKWVWARAQNELNTVFCLGFLKIQPSKQTSFWWEFAGLASPQGSLHAVTNNGKIKKSMPDSTATSPSFSTAVFSESELGSQGEVLDDREQPWWPLQANGEGEGKGKVPLPPKAPTVPSWPFFRRVWDMSADHSNADSVQEKLWKSDCTDFKEWEKNLEQKRYCTVKQAEVLSNQ